MHVCPERRPGRREEEKTAFLRLPRLLYWRGKKAVRVCSPREDFRELDSHGREAHIAAIVGVYDTYGADWTDLCAHVPELAAAVPASKGGLKGKGKGRPTLANPAAKPKAAPIAKGAAEPAAAPKAAEPKAAPKAKGAAVPASVEPASGSRDTRGTPPKAASGTLGGGRVPTSASSSEGTPVAAPVAKGAAPPAEPKEKPPATGAAHPRGGCFRRPAHRGGRVAEGGATTRRLGRQGGAR